MAGFDLISAKELMFEVIPDVPWVIEGLLGTGLHIFGGDSKISKSWLVYDMALEVAHGQDFWGYKTNRCEPLYLSLEDTKRRLQDRLWELTDEVCGDVKITTSAPRLDNGRIDMLTEHVAENENAKLIIIDTYQRVRSLGNDGSYINEYEELMSLKNFADENDISIVVVHHNSKQRYDDPFRNLLGSTALQGASDGMFVLTKDLKAPRTVVLNATGRDIESVTLKLQFSSHHWAVIEKLDAEERERESVPQAVLSVCQFIKATNAGWTGNAAELVEAVGLDSVKPAVLGKYLAQYRTYLLGEGVSYAREYTRSGNIIVLGLITDCEGCEGK